MNGNYEKFRRLLEELFQLDHADLDFGIYRIMNQKRDEIMRFLDDDLLPQVQEAFQEYQGGDRANIEAQLNETIQQIKSLGMDPETSSKVQELREQLLEAVDVTKLENEVFSDLYDFFRRYYSEGDFLSLRRYKEGVYAIPYEGEEVKLHWANHDQYYVKTSEYFRDYTFKLPSGKRVHFKLVEADTEKDNQKADAGKERRFILCEENPLVEVDGELHIRFEYRPHPDKAKQDTLNSAAFETIMNTTGYSGWKAELAQPMPTESNPNRTLLEKHLNDYTARNTFDYFIHKDLGRFLRRELDFYIKNEVMHLDDIENESAPRVEQYLSKIRVIRKIAHKIIQFLAQIEDFQKRIWLKKKFVTEIFYCITAGNIPEDFYPEIVENELQWKEWEALFRIHKLPKDLLSYDVKTPEGRLDFLNAYPTLMVDTRHFDSDFIVRLLGSFDDLDGITDGLLVHSENWQAMNLFVEKYRKRVKCIYIDPPYNSPSSEIVYKNNYKHSTWASLMYDRLELSRILQKADAGIVAAIDDHEMMRLKSIMETIFGEVETVVARSNPAGRSTPKGFSLNHEYAVFAWKNPDLATIGKLPHTTKQAERYKESDEIGPYEWVNFRKHGGLREESPKMYYPVFAKKNGCSWRIPKMVWNEHQNEWSLLEESGEDEIVLLPIDERGQARRWKWGVARLRQATGEAKIDNDRHGNSALYIKSRKPSEGVTPPTWWDKKEYSATDWGTRELKNLFGRFGGFDYPKAVGLVADCLIVISTYDNDYILDYFAGSGTTGHAVINLNREDGSRRRFILVEMGEHFDTVLLPRIKKVTFSPEWKDGEPRRMARTEETKLSPRVVKIIRLESYEDTLNNLELKRTEEQESLLAESDPFRESYMLSYMLDVESNGSPSLLNVDAFVDPFNYKLKIATGSAGETKPVTVDLVETFNYLIGLTVHHIDHIRGFRVVQGTNPEGEKVLVIWRNLKEKSNEDLEEFFRRQEYNPRDMEFDLIYVNGDNNLENIRRPDETWKVRLIEEDFKRLMFDVEDIK